MFLLSIPYPNIDPEIFAIDIGGFHLALRWYALAYVAGIIVAWRLMNWVISRPSYRGNITKELVDDLITWAVIGMIIGGRLVGTLVYHWDYYSQNLLEVIIPPYAGMSFHGGFLGVIAAVILVARKHGVNALHLGDLIALGSPFGLFFGRLANFINAELWGRETDVPWAVVFPGQDVARHPSQIYEALLEGVVLFAVLWLAYSRGALNHLGRMIGIFFMGYGLARVFVENFRNPDAQFITPENPLGHVIRLGEFGLTMGQTLSLPMVFIGLAFLLYSRRMTVENYAA